MFKKGDLVEIIGSDRGIKDVMGVRFILEHRKNVFSKNILEHVYGWETPIECHFAREIYLKKVNPDGDELCSQSFDEIMKSLKSKSNIVKVNLTLHK